LLLSIDDANNLAGFRKEEGMATVNATIAVNFDSVMFLTLVSNNPKDTVALLGKDVSLLPQSSDENQFNLIFQPGAGVRSVNGLAVTSISSTSVSVSTEVAGGIATAKCTYEGFQSPAPQANFTVFFTKASFEQVSDDPTIVFNPPSTLLQLAEAPVAAEAVMA
jgi:hypothetical protein